MNNTDKSKIALKYWFLGHEYQNALKALYFAEKTYTGFRKDGKTPEIVHSLTIANHARTFHKSLMFPEQTYAVALLHDVVEDYPVTIDEIEMMFGLGVGKDVELISKVVLGVKKSNEHYYAELATSPVASVNKGIDRINNQQTMIGVFSLEKQKSYIKEAEDFVLPMLKQARKNFPEQESIYENLKLVLNSQIELIRAIHEFK